jgi:hypothetical protein
MLIVKNQGLETKLENHNKEVNEIKEQVTSEKIHKDKILKDFADLEKKNLSLNEKIKDITTNYENQVKYIKF